MKKIVMLLIYILIMLLVVSGVYAIKIDTLGDQDGEKLDKNYVKMIKEVCKELKSDGRALKVWQIASTNIEEKPSCEVCNDFFLKVKVFCSVNMALLKKSNNVQREPSLMTIYTTSNLFSELANDEKLVDSSVKISMLLAYALRHYEPMTKGEKEYYDMLIPFIEKPFKKSYDKLLSDAKSNEKNKDEVLKGLFGE